MPTAVLSTVSTCKSRQVTSLKDSMMSSWMLSQTLGVMGPVRCGLLCLREQRCVSFLYNDVIRDCRLFAIVMASSDVTSSVVGYRYYETCKAAGYYGSPCSMNSQCVLSNTQCFQTRCRCKEGYSFNASSAACVARCGSYGPEFEYVPGWFIDLYTQEFVNGVTTTPCLELCRGATAYTCRSVDVRRNVNPACATSIYTKLDVPASSWQQSSTWDMAYYQRHCRL
ncbi:hypothetical protein ACOMHN_034463 [Nucella lapillus]